MTLRERGLIKRAPKSFLWVFVVMLAGIFFMCLLDFANSQGQHDNVGQPIVGLLFTSWCLWQVVVELRLRYR